LRVNQADVEHAHALLLALDPAALPPHAVPVLVREYVAHGADAVRAALEHALTSGLEAARDPADACTRMLWLRALAEGVAVSDDERIASAVRDAMPDAIERLELRVRRSYEPGEGLLDEPCDEQLRCAVALLAAFDLSGRLPYAMLAEELLQFARRWWNETEGKFDADVIANCTALDILGRLAALHRDPEYLRAAVVAPDRGYVETGRRTASWIEHQSLEQPAHRARRACALLTWFALEPDLQ
jgi:hypothetical protein